MSDSDLDSPSALDQFTDHFAAQGQKLLNQTSSPEQRQDVLSRFQALVSAHPKISALIALNILITGVPITVFFFFAIGVAISSLVTGLFIAVFVAGLWTLACVGIAFSILVPTVCFTTFIAFSVFFWLLVALYAFYAARAVWQYFSLPAESAPTVNGTPKGSNIEAWRDEFRGILDADRKNHDLKGPLGNMNGMNGLKP
ncbi:hypothetical protein BDY17DRAFT_323440 [Neohortaea acidophila]|uniref:Uncharacterized protein n=1 Tax=Neohortaea acidophila TaxID=245834 RepID=A0A6A6PWP7_9PEZI|nr:uncharacterized protein BDY17DRAFT_323440 [Neohortaea acidophila]KAF2484598.1 hypothetical protein BDY17DRAFT_323440 [Neohortaea acidophila]